MQVFASQFSAVVSLSIEIYTLIVARVPRAQWRKHIGRGQFPQVKSQSVLPRKPAQCKFDCLAFCLWATLCHSLATLVWHAGRVSGELVPVASLPVSVVSTVLKLKGWREQWHVTKAEQELEPEDLEENPLLDLRFVLGKVFLHLVAAAAAVSKELLKNAAKAAEMQKKHWFSKKARSLNTGFREWFRAAMEKGAVEAHKLLKKQVATDSATERHIGNADGKTLYTAPARIAQQAKPWGQFCLKML